jgi:hypothetical protein
MTRLALTTAGSALRKQCPFARSHGNASPQSYPHPNFNSEPCSLNRRAETFGDCVYYRILIGLFNIDLNPSYQSSFNLSEKLLNTDKAMDDGENILHLVNPSPISYKAFGAEIIKLSETMHVWFLLWQRNLLYTSFWVKLRTV